MSKDIRFYDFDFNLVHILPESAADIGYTSMNAVQEFNSSGSLELVFYDSELKKKIKDYRCNLLVIWNGFQGFLTSYIWNTQYKVMGMHLNGLLHRAVIPTAETLSGTVEELARSAISKNIPWLTLGEEKGFTTNVEYTTKKYLTADEYIQDLLDMDNAGYKIFADIPNKKLVFECIKPSENRIMFSEENLNAYDFEQSYINKELAFGGWFLKEQTDDEGNALDPIWTYITTDDAKEGIYKIDTVLSANTKTEALEELKQFKSDQETLFKIRNSSYGTDYDLGDIVRVQNNGITEKKLVSGINRWQEHEYGEQPILKEWED